MTLLLALVLSDLRSDLQAIAAVEPGDQTIAAAAAAVGRLGTGESQTLLPIAKAMGRSGPLADNYLRAAFEAVASRAQSLPDDELIAFFNDRQNDPRARRLVYELLLDRGLVTGDSSDDQTLPQPRTDDPSPEMRRDAIDRVLTDGEQVAAGGDDPTELYLAALPGATLKSQFDELSERLADSGDAPNYLDHFRFLTDWVIIGPFDNKDEANFDKSYPPEQSRDLNAKYTSDFAGESPTGETPDELSWTRAVVDQKTAELNLHDVAANYKGSLFYVVAAFESDRGQPVQLRLATENAFKLWLNGELLVARPEYHRSKRFDQYVVPGTARAGKNEVLIKLLQNEQTQGWAQEYDVTVRVTDPNGLAAEVQPVAP